MTSKVLYSNSNEICHLIESTTGWTVTPLDRLDRLDTWSNSLLLFDTLFREVPVEWTVSELLEIRPEWEDQILPLLKSHLTFLFTGEWCVLSCREDKILFRPFLSHPMTLSEGDCLLCTQSLTFGLWQEIKRLIEPASHARDLGVRLTEKLKRPIDLGIPSEFRDVCDKLEDLVMELDMEVSDWKDRFFFDALDAHEKDLCHECKENMRVAFYVSDDRSQALKWRPHGDWCSQKECQYYKSDIFDDLYADDVREDPIVYEGSSD